MLRPAIKKPLNSTRMQTFLAASTSVFDIAVVKERNHAAFLDFCNKYEQDRAQRNDSKNIRQYSDYTVFLENKKKILFEFQKAFNNLKPHKYELFKLISNIFIAIELFDRLDLEAQRNEGNKKTGVFKVKPLPPFNIPSYLKESKDDKEINDIVTQYQTKFNILKEQKESEEKKLATSKSTIANYREEMVVLQKRFDTLKKNPVDKIVKVVLILELDRLKSLIESEEKEEDDAKIELERIKKETDQIQKKAKELNDLISGFILTLQTKLANIKNLEDELLFLKEIKDYLNKQPLFKVAAIDALIEKQFTVFNKKPWHDYKGELKKIYSEFSNLPEKLTIENVDNIRKNFTSCCAELAKFQVLLTPLLPEIINMPPNFDVKKDKPKRKTLMGTSAPPTTDEKHSELLISAKPTAKFPKLSETVKKLLAEIRVIEIITPTIANPPVIESATVVGSSPSPISSHTPSVAPGPPGLPLALNLPPSTPSPIPSTILTSSPASDVSSKASTSATPASGSLISSAPAQMSGSSSALAPQQLPTEILRVEPKKTGFFSKLGSHIKSAWNAFDEWTDNHPWIWRTIKYIIIPAVITAAVVFSGGLATIPAAFGFASAKTAGFFTAAAMGKTAAIQFGASLGALEIPLFCTEARRCFKKPSQTQVQVIHAPHTSTVGGGTAYISRTANMPISNPSTKATATSVIQPIPVPSQTHYAFQGMPTQPSHRSSMRFGSGPN